MCSLFASGPRTARTTINTIDCAAEKLEENKAKVKEILQKSDELVKNIDKMKIVSHELPGDLNIALKLEAILGVVLDN